MQAKSQQKQQHTLQLFVKIDKNEIFYIFAFVFNGSIHLYMQYSMEQILALATDAAAAKDGNARALMDVRLLDGFHRHAQWLCEACIPQIRIVRQFINLRHMPADILTHRVVMRLAVGAKDLLILFYLTAIIAGIAEFIIEGSDLVPGLEAVGLRLCANLLNGSRNLMSNLARQLALDPVIQVADFTL